MEVRATCAADCPSWHGGCETVYYRRIVTKDHRINVSRSQVPSILLAASGFVIILIGLQWYIDLVPQHETSLGWAREIALVGHLLFGGGLTTIGVYEFRQKRYDVSVSLLTGLLTLTLLVAFDFWSVSTNTQFVLSIALLLVGGSIVGTWYLLQRSVS